VTAGGVGRGAGRSRWPDDVLENLAIAYHQLYRETAGPDDDVARLDWEQLPEHLRESNRTTARALGRELARLGYDVRRASGDGQGLDALPPEHVQRLAEAEHARWVDQKASDGYVYGPERRHEGAPRTHPDMVGWSRLTAAAKDKDRVRFTAAPRLLATLGYEIVRRHKS
jgi:hypothetical protein